MKLIDNTPIGTRTDPEAVRRRAEDLRFTNQSIAWNGVPELEKD